MGTETVKVLLVEDTGSDAELLEFALRGVPLRQFSITRVETWADALEHLHKGQFDVLLLDLSLPDSRGPETFLRARAAAPRLPIIVLTGNEDEAIALEAARHGIEDYLVKGDADGRTIARAIHYAIESTRARETVSNYRELVHTILETTSEAIYAKDLEGRYLLANAAAARLVGRTPEEVLGKQDPQILFPEDAKTLTERDRSVLAAAKTLSFEEVLTVASGERRTFLSTKGPLRDAAGNILGVFGMSHDVTDMKRAERRLQGVAALLNLFASGLSRRDYLESVVKFLRDWCGCECVGIRLLNKAGRLPYAAQVGFKLDFMRYENKLLPATGDCACSRILMRRGHPEDTTCMSAGGSLCCNQTSLFEPKLRPICPLAGHIACVKAGYQSMVHVPLRYPDQLIGSVHFADSESNKFSPETVSFIEAAALLIAEAVHRLSVEESLVESEARFRTMFERHVAVMLLVDPETGAIVEANRAGAAFYGYSAQQLRQMKLGDLFQVPPEAAPKKNRRAAREARSFWGLMHRLANGETRMVEAHSSPIHVQGRPLLFYIIHDVTERALLQKQVLEIGEQERQRVGQDLHDSLGGKLTGAALMSKALAQKLSTLGLSEAELAQEIVQCINESIRHTRSIARGLFPVELSGSGLAVALAEFAAETERHCDVRCLFRADDGFHIEQPFVALHLFRLALEAVNNALRHAQAREICISLTTTPTYLGLEVRDDGKGLPSDWTCSSGLGLRTMKYRAETIGARLNIGPGDQGGTVISCLLPRADGGTSDNWQL